MDSRHDALTTVLTELANKVASIPPPFLTPLPPSLKPPKLLLPTFDGSEVLDWIFQVEQYFLFYNVAPPQCTDIVGFYMVGEALSWHKWMHTNHQLSTWDTIVRAMELRFGPSSYENHQATLFKLRQAKSVAAYQAEFKKILNRVVGLAHEALLNCFISGPQLDIQQELAILRPHSLSQVMGLAKLIESKLNDTAHSPPARQNESPTPPLASLPLPKPSPSSPLPIRRLTPIEMQARHAKGLCFNCDDKFHPGRPCSN